MTFNRTEPSVYHRGELKCCHLPRRVAFLREFRNEGLQVIKSAEGRKSFVNERPQPLRNVKYCGDNFDKITLVLLPPPPYPSRSNFSIKKSPFSQLPSLPVSRLPAVSGRNGKEEKRRVPTAELAKCPRNARKGKQLGDDLLRVRNHRFK